MEKNKGGRPPFYKTPDELQAAVDKYFQDCAGVLLYDKSGRIALDRNNRPIYEGKKPLTMAGLSLACGFKNIVSFTRQKYRNGGFYDVVMLARLRIEQYNEERLFDRDGYKGAAFNLFANYGWNKPDPQPLQVNVKIIPPKEGATKKQSDPHRSAQDDQ